MPPINSNELHNPTSLLSYNNRCFSISSSSSSISSSSSSSSSCRSSSSSCSSSSSFSNSSSSSSCRSSSSSSSSRSPSCWIAAEIFGGWFKPKTIASRFYITNIAPNSFKNFYIKHGRQIATYISNKPILKVILRPMFEYFVLRTKLCLLRRKV